MVTRGTSAWRHTYWGNPCQPKFKSVEIGRAVLYVDYRIFDAAKALDQVFNAFKYDVHPTYPEGDTGAYNCRNIKGTSVKSSHSWATAIDINWNSNPWTGYKLVTDMPRDLTNAIEDIKTNNGIGVWRWGGDWDDRPETPHNYYDAMHFEINATPDELAAGINWKTVVGGNGKHTTVGSKDVLKQGDSGPEVEYLQRTLNKLETDNWDKPLKRDGDFGPKTEASVKRRQGVFKYKQTGVFDISLAFRMGRVRSWSDLKELVNE